MNDIYAVEETGYMLGGNNVLDRFILQEVYDLYVLTLHNHLERR